MRLAYTLPNHNVDMYDKPPDSRTAISKYSRFSGISNPDQYSTFIRLFTMMATPLLARWMMNSMVIV